MDFESVNDAAAAAAREAGLLAEIYDDAAPETTMAAPGQGTATEDSDMGASAEAPAVNIAEPRGNASGNKLSGGSALATITVFASDDKTLSKRYALGADGRLVSDGSACAMSSGLAQRFDASTADELAAIINKCEPRNAICVGRFINPALQKTRITTAGREADGEISRTKENFDFADGPGWAPLDADGTGDADVFATLCAVIPELLVTARVSRASTSFGLSNAFTGELFPASGGVHIFPLLKDQRDLPRFVEDLNKRLWLAGHGWIKLAANGKALERSPVDTALKDPTRLIFEGGPDLGPGLAQAARPAVAYAGGALDSLLACPPLSEAEVGQYKRLVAEAKARKQTECDQVRTDWDAGHIKARMAKGMPEAEARAAVSRITDGDELDPLFELHFDRLGVVTVADVLANSKKYVDQPMADPIEGVAYGHGKAKLYRRPDGGLWVKSFAHGDCEYTLPAPERASAESVFDDDQATVERIAAQDAERAGEKADAETDPLFSKYRIGDIRKKTVTPPRYLVKGHLNRGATSVWFGPPKGGKSGTITHCCVHIAAGIDWVGCKTKRAVVVYFAYERAEETEERRITACHKLGIEEDLPFYVVGTPPSLISSTGVNEMIALVEALRARHPGVEHLMLVCDTLAAATPGAELAGSAHMTAALNRLQRVRDHFDAHLVIITHTPKNDPTTARDSGALIGHADVAYNVYQKKIAMTHCNRGELARPLPFTFEGVVMGRDEDGANYEVLFTDVREAKVDVERPAADVNAGAAPARATVPMVLGPVDALEIDIIDTLRAADVGREPFTFDGLRDLLKENGDLPTDGKDAVTPLGRKHFERALANLRRAKKVSRAGERVFLVGSTAAVGVGGKNAS